MTIASELERKAAEVLLSDSLSSQVAPLILRTYLLVKAKPELMDKKYPLHNGKERSLMDLMDDDSSGIFEHAMVFNKITSTLFAINNDFRPDQQLWKSLFEKIRINSFGAGYDPDIHSYLGMGLYIETSVFDHSCRPNASWNFSGKKMEIRAMKSIPAGEEVLVHYIHILSPKADRQQQLLKGWGFLCRCVRCQAGDQPGEIRELLASRAYQEINPEGLSEEQQVDAAFYGLLKVLPIREKYWGPFNPSMTLDMWEVASVMNAKPNKSIRDMIEYKKLVLKWNHALRITHGEGHEMFK